MTFAGSSNRLGMPVITDHSTTKKVPLGTVITAVDPDLGEGEFIYLKGVASTIVGSIVNYDDGFQTALDTASATGISRSVAVAMSACVASEYGWYQIGGLSVAAKSAAVSFADGAGIGSTAGLAVAVVSGVVLQGAIVRTVASAKSGVTTVAIAINRPHTPDAS